MRFSFKYAMINFLWAYIIVTLLAYSLSYAMGTIFNLPSAEELGVSMFEDPAFVKTVPYHLFINFICWTFFGYRYLKKINAVHIQFTYYLSCGWLIVAIVVDFVGFVLIKSPVSLTPYQFYIEYQPWISVTYAIVFISPLVAHALLKRKYSLS